MAACWTVGNINEIMEEVDKKKLQKVISALEVLYIGASNELYFFLDNNERSFSIKKKLFNIKKLVSVTLRFRSKYPV